MTQNSAGNNPTCKDCRFFRGGAASAQTGECHFGPPLNEPSGKSAWPEVQRSDWCGKFQAQFTAVQFDGAAIGKAVDELVDFAAEFLGSISEGLARAFEDVERTRREEQAEKARPLEEETKVLIGGLGIYQDGWRSAAAEMQQKVLKELTWIADEFLYEGGQWNQKGTIMDFLAPSHWPETSAERQGALNYFLLMERAHVLLNEDKRLPRSHRQTYRDLICAMMEKFQKEVYPLTIPYPFSRRWSWAHYRSL